MEKFSNHVSDGDTISWTKGGFDLTATIHSDGESGPPWEEADGHGPVTEWTSRPKNPGERILVEDGPFRRYYDIQEAVRIAKKDGWGFLPYRIHIDRIGPVQEHRASGGFVTAGPFEAADGTNFNRAIAEIYKAHAATMTPAEYAAKAVDRDFEYLQGWCNGDWQYVGLVVTASRNGIDLGSSALWGIEANTPMGSNATLNEVLPDLEFDAISEASEIIEKLCGKAA